MPQKSRRQKEHAQKHRMHLVDNSTSVIAASNYTLPKTITTATETPRGSKSTSVTAQNAFDFAHVIKDLRRISIITAALLAIEIALFFTLT